MSVIKQHEFKSFPNDSGLHPVGRFILIRPKAVAEVSRGGIVLASPEAQRKEQMGQTDGVVIACGLSAWNDQEAPFAQPGDHVVFGRYNGLFRKQPDGNEYRLISDLEVVAILTGESK